MSIEMRDLRNSYDPSRGRIITSCGSLSTDMPPLWGEEINFIFLVFNLVIFILNAFVFQYVNPGDYSDESEHPIPLESEHPVLREKRIKI